MLLILRSIAGLSPTSKNVAALFVRRDEKLSEEQKAYLGRLCDADGSLADARRLTQDFAKMVRGLEGEKLGGWLEEAEACNAAAMRNFAVGLKKDLAAVRAGLTETGVSGKIWSTRRFRQQHPTILGPRQCPLDDAARRRNLP